ncbi:tRNA (adenosine(37)-N6)-threonylcarbamoyltransferase complex ATPase subunit type 1 TsaE, partial [Mizugakiibacter sediminis]|uniref:tRNA (adenosine(37)-N6)-threonylcarbamoyltransferase complex ATPase subunit type 1 TsaE n=1 Tax=Mizugakiibacter sediminis TaxID=1475481 RepID=UPI0009E40D43
ALGVGERVKSPTYSLIESYRFDGRAAHHLDLYRIADPAELEYLGLDALAEPGGLVLVEWPERGAGALPPPDWRLDLVHAGSGRRARLTALSPAARQAVERV